MLDFVLQLRLALTDSNLQKLDRPEQVDEAARDAAFAVAGALGRCRAAQQDLPSDIAGTLDGAVAIAATEHGRWLVGRLKLRFQELISASANPTSNVFQDQDARYSIVLARHELWAATNAISEADDALAADGECPATLTDQLMLLIEETAALDAMLIQHVDELALAAELPLLRNLRSSVSDAVQVTPWWLDGTIESAAENRTRAFLSALPNPKLIEKRVQAGASKAVQTAAQREHEPIALVARLLSGLTVSRTAPAEASGSHVSVQVTATPEGAGRSLTVSIACNTSGPQRVDWEGVPVRLELLHTGSRYYCTLNEDGQASMGSLPLGTYRIQSWATAVRMDDPSLRGGQRPELSRDRSIRVSVLEDLKSVEVVMSTPLPANARLMGVLVNADGTEALSEREIDLTDQPGGWRGTILLDARAEQHVLTLAAAADAQFEWLLLFVERI